MITIKTSTQDSFKAQMAIEDNRFVYHHLEQTSSNTWILRNVNLNSEDSDELGEIIEAIENLFETAGVECYEFN